MSKGKIPDRWIPYHACGDVIEGTRLICFKVPLLKKVQLRIPGITRIWDIPAVLEEIPNLGAVIDLTNTARYYNPRDFEAANVLHKKILMPGREIPPEDKVREFMDAVDEFLGKDCDSLVGVHCTHGLNRTGYMVCRYMRDRLKIPAMEAIDKFEKARGYKMERDNYLADLNNKKPPPPDLDWNGTQPRHEIKTQSIDKEIQLRDGDQSQPRKKNESQLKQRDASQPSNKDESRPTNNGKDQPRNKNRSRKRNNKDEDVPKPKKRKIYYI